MTDPIVIDEETADYRAAQIAEWSKWEAREPITVGNAPAYNVGDPVPQDNVERLGYAKAGRVRLQAAWVADHPDDADVKTFLAWAKDHPDHADVKAWESYRETRDELDAAKAEDNPFAEARTPAAKAESDPPSEPVASARVARKATPITTDKE